MEIWCREIVVLLLFLFNVYIFETYTLFKKQKPETFFFISNWKDDVQQSFKTLTSDGNPYFDEIITLYLGFVYPKAWPRARYFELFCLAVILGIFS